MTSEERYVEKARGWVRGLFPEVENLCRFLREIPAYEESLKEYAQKLEARDAALQEYGPDRDKVLPKQKELDAANGDLLLQAALMRRMVEAWA